MVTATGYLLEEVVGLAAEGTKGADYKGDYSHTVTGGGGSTFQTGKNSPWGHRALAESDGNAQSPLRVR